MATLRSDGKAFLAIFIGAMITITFLATIADSIFEQTHVRTYVNQTTTAGAVNVTVDIAGRTLISTIEVYNATGANSTQENSCLNLGCNLQTGVGTDGLQTVQLVINDTASAAFASRGINLTYSAQPDGYLANSGARSVNTLVIIMGALAIFVTIIVILYGATMGDLIRRM